MTRIIINEGKRQVSLLEIHLSGLFIDRFRFRPPTELPLVLVPMALDHQNSDWTSFVTRHHSLVTRRQLTGQRKELI